MKFTITYEEGQFSTDVQAAKTELLSEGFIDDFPAMLISFCESVAIKQGNVDFESRKMATVAALKAAAALAEPLFDMMAAESGL